MSTDDPILKRREEQRVKILGEYVHDPINSTIPLAMLGAAALLFAVIAYVSYGIPTGNALIEGLVQGLALTLVVGLLCMAVATALFSASFGRTEHAAFKLAALYVTTRVIAIVSVLWFGPEAPLGLIDVALSLLVTVFVVSWMFDLETIETAVMSLVLACLIHSMDSVRPTVITPKPTEAGQTQDEATWSVEARSGLQGGGTRD